MTRPFWQGSDEWRATDDRVAQHLQDTTIAVANNSHARRRFLAERKLIVPMSVREAREYEHETERLKLAARAAA